MYKHVAENFRNAFATHRMLLIFSIENVHHSSHSRIITGIQICVHKYIAYIHRAYIVRYGIHLNVKLNRDLYKRLVPSVDVDNKISNKTLDTVTRTHSSEAATFFFS